MTVAISENTGSSRERSLANLRPFKPGQSGNPGGRPKGLVRRIREETRDGEELVEYMLSVFRDEKASQRERIEAATWLADRGFGKPTQPLRQEVELPGDPLAEKTPEQKRAELAMLQERIAELRALGENGRRLGPARSAG